MSTGHYLLALTIGALLAWLSLGCATYEVYELDRATGQMVLVGKGQSVGAFRDLSVAKQYDAATGKLVGETTVSKSTTSDIMGAANQLIGTATATAAKVAP